MSVLLGAGGGWSRPGGVSARYAVVPGLIPDPGLAGATGRTWSDVRPVVTRPCGCQSDPLVFGHPEPEPDESS